MLITKLFSRPSKSCFPRWRVDEVAFVLFLTDIATQEENHGSWKEEITVILMDKAVGLDGLKIISSPRDVILEQYSPPKPQS